MTKKSSAERRLLRDLKEILVERPEFVSGEPLPDNLFEWHCNILAPPDSPHHGICIHLVMHFPEQYPVRPPSVHLCSAITHSHVFGGFICLDLLETHAAEESYFGWSSSYTVLSILLQLQSFFLDDEDWEQHGGSAKSKQLVRGEVQASMEFACDKCAHDALNGSPWPWHWESLRHGSCAWKSQGASVRKKSASASQVPSFWESEISSIATSSSFLPSDASDGNLPPVRMARDFPALGSKIPKHKSKSNHKKKNKRGAMLGNRNQTTPLSSVLTLPQDILVHILSFLDDILIKRIEGSIKQFAACAKSPYLWARRELVCFHTKQNMEEDVLGIGICLDFTRTSKKLQSVTSPLDIISRSAFFEDKIRLSVWKEPFQFFLPLYISGSHAKRAAPFFSHSLDSIYKDMKVEGAHKNHVVLALDLLTKLMSSMVVEIMKGYTHASIKALEGYGHFQRWMIHLVQENPGLLDAIDKRVMQMVNSAEHRHKDVLPNLGEFLPLLSVSSVKWGQVCVPLVEECLDRNGLWIKFKYPKLARVNEPTRTSERLEKSFECSAVGLRLVMFHMHFLRVSRTSNKKALSLQEIADNYDRRFGKASLKMQEELQREIFKIQKTNTYEEFFNYVGYPTFKGIQLNMENMEKILIKAMREMHKKGYDKKPDSAQNMTAPRENRNFTSSRGGPRRQMGVYHRVNERMQESGRQEGRPIPTRGVPPARRIPPTPTRRDPPTPTQSQQLSRNRWAILEESD